MFFTETSLIMYRKLICMVAMCLCVGVGSLMAQGKATNRVYISKPSMELTVYDRDNRVLMHCVIGCGKVRGNKQKSGDNRTPEGEFPIIQIQNSSYWAHDFGDGKGLIQKAYGPYFIRLGVSGFSGIGIHGTCFPESIGTRCSEGCIRLHNDDVERLVQLVAVGSMVTIEGDIDRELTELAYQKDSFVQPVINISSHQIKAICHER